MAKPDGMVTLADGSTIKLEPGEVLVAAPKPGVLPEVASTAGETQTLFGTIVYNSRSKLWRLRFANAAEDDPFGGVVTLRGIEPFAHGLRDGMQVSVRGELVHAQTQSLNPDFAVRDVAVGGK